MFIVEIGSVVTTFLAIRDPTALPPSIAVWLWFTVLFANFAEAVAEGRGKAQADTLRRTRSETMANVRRPTALRADRVDRSPDRRPLRRGAG